LNGIGKIPLKNKNMQLFNLTDIKEFLFENKAVKQTIFKNTFWLTIGMGLNRILKLVLFIYAARILGAAEYGKFAFALAFVSLFGIFQDFGISTIVTREFAREEKKEEEFNSLVSLEFLLSLGTFILILASSFFVTTDPDIIRTIMILALFGSFNSMVGFFYSFFQALQRMEYQAWAEIIQAALVTGLGIFILFKIPSAENFSYAYLFSALVGLFFILFYFHFKIFPLRLVWEKEVWKKFLLMSWPMALAGLFDSIYTYTDSVMLGHWGMFAETGWYNAAFRITWTIYLFTILASASFYPVLSKAFKKSKEELQKIWNYQMELTIILTIPLVIGGVVLGPKIINLFYGASFAPSILAFQILMIMIGILLVYLPFYQAILVSNQQKKLLLSVFIGAMSNVVLNLILIPKYTLYGAAAATVISHLLIFFLLFIFTFKFTSIRIPYSRFLSVFLGVFLSGTIMFFLISSPQIYNLNVFLSIFIGGVIYFIALLAFKKIIPNFKLLPLKNNVE